MERVKFHHRRLNSLKKGTKKSINVTKTKHDCTLTKVSLRNLLILKWRREWDSDSGICSGMYNCITCRFHVALDAKLATNAVDHCTLLHAGPPVVRPCSEGHTLDRC